MSPFAHAGNRPDKSRASITQTVKGTAPDSELRPSFLTELSTGMLPLDPASAESRAHQ